MRREVLTRGARQDPTQSGSGGEGSQEGLLPGSLVSGGRRAGGDAWVHFSLFPDPCPELAATGTGSATAVPVHTQNRHKLQPPARPAWNL